MNNGGGHSQSNRWHVLSVVFSIEKPARLRRVCMSALGRRNIVSESHNSIELCCVALLSVKAATGAYVKYQNNALVSNMSL